VAWVRKRTIPTERSPLVGEVNANFCGWRVTRGQRDGSLRPYCRFSRQEPLLFYQVAPQLYSLGIHQTLNTLVIHIICLWRVLLVLKHFKYSIYLRKKNLFFQLECNLSLLKQVTSALVNLYLCWSLKAIPKSKMGRVKRGNIFQKGRIKQHITALEYTYTYVYIPNLSSSNLYSAARPIFITRSIGGGGVGVAASHVVQLLSLQCSLDGMCVRGEVEDRGFRFSVT
jgi:hypothetical protein